MIYLLTISSLVQSPNLLSSFTSTTLCRWMDWVFFLFCHRCWCLWLNSKLVSLLPPRVSVLYVHFIKKRKKKSLSIFGYLFNCQLYSLSPPCWLHGDVAPTSPKSTAVKSGGQLGGTGFGGQNFLLSVSLFLRDRRKEGCLLPSHLILAHPSPS